MANGDILTLTVDRFRSDFPSFSDETTHPSAIIQGAINRAYQFVSRKVSAYLMDEDAQMLALELMTAHIKTIGDKIAQGNSAGGMVGASTVGDVSITLIPPIIKRNFDFWINQTQFGQEYVALLGSQCPAGLFLGGSNQRVFR